METGQIKHAGRERSQRLFYEGKVESNRIESNQVKSLCITQLNSRVFFFFGCCCHPQRRTRRRGNQKTTPHSVHTPEPPSTAWTWATQGPPTHPNHVFLRTIKRSTRSINIVQEIPASSPLPLHPANHASYVDTANTPGAYDPLLHARWHC